MNVLLSAYACEPGKGSEPGVGWHWALEIARLGHDVWVLTRANNRPVIEAEIAKMPHKANLHFLYYDLPVWARWWKKGRRGIRLYYSLWQWGAYRIARKVHGRERFDRVHHVTFATVRQPSFMGNLGIPFIFGPVGGGEQAPWRLRRGYGWRGWILDALRDLLNLLIRFDPLMRHTFRQAETIYVRSAQSRSIIPRAWRSKARCLLGIGIDPPGPASITTAGAADPPGFRVLYAGHFLYLKGMHLGLPAFARMQARCPGARLTIVGKGPDERRWRRLAERLGVGPHLDWVPWVEKSELAKLYLRHQVLLFPSLHDSGGMVVLEAMARGLPVVCLDLGGPGMLVDESCGRVINTQGRRERAVAGVMAAALEELFCDARLWRQLSEGALRRAGVFTWSNQVRHLYPPETPVSTRAGTA